MIIPRCIHPPPEAHQKAEEGEALRLAVAAGEERLRSVAAVAVMQKRRQGQQGRPVGSPERPSTVGTFEHI